MNRATIVIPCYNEAERLHIQKFETFLRRTPGIGFLFVDDGSTDGTSRLVEGLCDQAGDRCRLVGLPTNMGKAEAVRRGILAALETPSEYIGFWDADLATPLEAIPAFCEILDDRPEIEVVIGSRVQLLGRTIERKAARHYLGRIFTTVISLMLGLKVYDTQCGAKLFRASENLKALFGEPFYSKWVFDVEVLARLIRSRRSRHLPAVDKIVYELPLMEWKDVAGSKLRLRDFFTAMVDVARIYWKVL